MIYLIIILSGMVIISLLNIFLNPMGLTWYAYPLIVLFFTIMVIALDGLTAFIIRKLPEKYFKEDNRITTMGSFQRKFYEFIGVRKWKDSVPELGNFTSFHKDKIYDPFNNEYLEKYMMEARYGIFIHYISSPVSYLIMLLDIGMYMGSSDLFLTIALPVAAVNSVLILLPAFILKYNLRKLKILYERNKRKSVK